MSFTVSKKMDHIAAFQVMELLAQSRQMEREGRSIIHMEIGEPDFATPEKVIAAGCKALQSGKTHYTPALGLPELREALSAYYQSQFSLTIDPRRIILTPGASGALQLVMAVLLNSGDRVLITDPGYPCYRNFIRLYGAEPIAIPLEAEDGFVLAVDQVSKYWDRETVGLVVASPANPTGAVISQQEMEAMAAIVRDQNGRLIVDEIYQGLTFTDQQQTALAISDEIFVVNSFSKYFGMTGWRLGWVVAPEAYVPVLDRLAQNLFLAPPTPAQYAALEAVKPENLQLLDERREEFKHRRDYLLPELRALGFDIPVTPEGAFYIYAGCKALSVNSKRLAADLLQQAGVVVTPGSDFGGYKAAEHVRFAYTVGLDKLKEGVAKIKGFLT